jgi:hypothetical protein
MEKYEANIDNYEVFGANMTVDKGTDIYSPGILTACKSCQCNCRLCIGGRLPEDGEMVCEAEAENALENLLAA